MEKEELFSLVENAIGGDEDAFATLYTAQIKSIIFGVKSWLYDKGGVEDATSEVVLKMYKSISQLSSPFAFKAWTQRIIMNVCVDINNKAKKDSGYDLSDYEAVLVDESSDTNPEASAMSGDEGSDLKRAIHALPDSQKRTLMLYYYEDMNYQEIAEALDITVSTVSTNLIRAKKKLKGTLEMNGIGFDNLNVESKSDSFAVAVTAVLGSDVSSVASSGEVDSILKACQAKVHNAAADNNSNHSDTSVKTVSSLSIGKIVALVSLSAFIIAAGIFLSLTIKAADYEISTDPAIAVSDNVYKPDVEIAFSGGTDIAEHINPITASIQGYGENDKIVEWYIYNEAKEEMKSGTGFEINEVSDGLAPGNYSLMWVLASESGNEAEAIREFVVK
jgi:RNA polymerase sigma-70 factor (ECF subfamily)